MQTRTGGLPRGVVAVLLAGMLASIGCADSEPTQVNLPKRDTGNVGDVGPEPDTGGFEEDTWTEPVPDVGPDTSDPGDVDPPDTDPPEECPELVIPNPTDRDDPCQPDGGQAVSVFVATYGDDANPGTMALPKLTIGAALEVAAADPERHFVLVETGVYEEDVVLREGVHLVGGYGFGWGRDGRQRSTVRGGNPTISGANLNRTTLVADLVVEPTQAVEPGATVVTMYLENSPGAILQNLKIVGGQGGTGQNGARGIKGVDGENGRKGADAPPDDNWGICANRDSTTTPGDGAPAPCATGAGGRGGAGGFGDNRGAAGVQGEGGAPGGNGGASLNNGQDGAPGQTGQAGGAGQGAAATGYFDGLDWRGASGTAGAAGAPGRGGGGGGGGGGGTAFCDSWGGAGGGGGSGGCGGTGGEGGRPGGASVALFLYNSDVVIERCEIQGGTGGTGGAGGEGGEGGDGGEGGPGGANEDDSGFGGKGGMGGRGGKGGLGGGGAGGPSYAVYSDRAMSREPVDSQILFGTGGRGGGQGTARGADGESVAIKIGE